MYICWSAYSYVFANVNNNSLNYTGATVKMQFLDTEQIFQNYRI